MDIKLVDIREVAAITGISRSTIYNLRKENKFPKPVNISTRRIAWHLRDIADWTEKLARK